jgi:flagellar motor switch protein FliM
LDPKLVGLSIERILGGSGEGSRGRRKLTELEEGVVSFGILKVLQHFQNGWEHANQLALTLERFTSGTDELNETLLSSSHYYSIGFRIGVGSQLMFLRIILPQALIVNSVFSQPAQSGSTDEDRGYMRRLLSTLGEKQLNARVELAQLDLNKDDLATLEAGDIILIENHQLELSPDGVRGAAFVRIGTGDNGGLQCSIINDGTQPRLQINQIIIQEKPAESVAPQPTDESMTDAEQPEEIELAPTEVEDNLEETEGLLRDVEAPIVIELGRLQMNTAQVIRLKAGQILRLPRGATDPVDLVVNDKVFARGELIEVDGELGVRLVQVTGA